ncbi:PAS domain S-box protein [Novosphingobium sp. JCM 18896]|uniref:PAS domain S-box protein n=1 Tax=Novosphingobium sp. JCM 18896 TaxID=2989731 RepID=UPI002223290C|nr:PAS domain S-box protein [Novosphingobium sp. JCM 18896]MCW1432233.1 PAS domain S-box protein [Novosphingobium sp. JCM 18896]
MNDDLSEIFVGNSEMAGVMRNHAWAETALGDPRGWPDALKIPLRMLLTSRFEMWLGWGPDLCFFYNDAYIPTLGIKHPSMLGRPFREVWSEVYDEVADQVERVQAGQATWNRSLLLLLERSGYTEETYHSFSYSPLYEADGGVGGLLCVVSEDTARIISVRRLETLSRLGTELSGATTKSSVRAAVHSAFETNRRDFPFIAVAIDDLVEPDGDDEVFEKIAAELASGVNDGATIISLPSLGWPSGDWKREPRDALVLAIPGHGGEAALGTIVLGLNPYRAHGDNVLDIAQLAAAQIGSALAKVMAIDGERRRADRIWTISRDLIVVVDEKGIFRSVSPAWTRILGHPIEEVVGKPFSDFMHPADIAHSKVALERALGSEELSNYENRFRTDEGFYRSFQWHTTSENGFVYAYGRDVTESRQVEEALSESEEQFRHLVQSVTDYAIYMIDLDGYVSSWNEGARRIKGYEPDEIIGEHFSRFYTEVDRAIGEPQRALETARNEGRFLAEGWRVRKDGERFRASVVIDAVRDDRGRAIGFAKITRDVTERERTQRELEVARETLFQSQKMDAIGQLTGGVAHDFNNLLMAVMSSLELLGKRLPADPLTKRLFDNAVEGAKRGATLTQRMLAFARRQDLQVDRIDLSQLLSGMNDLVQRSIGPEWPISTSFPLKLPQVCADANQLEMALLNLIVNARDASPGGGAILISAACEDVADGMIDDLSAGSYVRMGVKDNGIGMDADTLQRATEPFFTTKGVGKGTGLGLPMVHGMARQIGGTFQLLSEVGRGTSAVIWLPVANAEAEPADDSPVQTDRRGTRSLTILAVDDDALVLMNTVALLEDLGHDVIEASSGRQALEVFAGQHDIDMLITDQAMPMMTGVELIEAIDAIRPGTPAIIASGYGEGVEVPGREVVRLGKPFNQSQLADAVIEAVGSNVTRHG